MELHEDFERVRREREAEDQLESLVDKFDRDIADCSREELHDWCMHLYTTLLERGVDPYQDQEQSYSIPLESLATAEDVNRLNHQLNLLKNSLFWITLLLVVSFFR